MKIGVCGKRDKVLEFVNDIRVSSQYHVTKIKMPECINYCGPNVEISAYLLVLETYVDFNLVRQKKYRSLEISLYALGKHEDCKNYVKARGQLGLTAYPCKGVRLSTF